MRRTGPAPTGGGADEVDIDVADVHLNVPPTILLILLYYSQAWP